jgi:acetyl-CoA carboxylase alpha subunit
VDADALQAQIPEAVEAARRWMLRRRGEVEATLNEKLQTQLDRLEELKARHEQQLEQQFAQSDRPEAIIEGQKQKRQREIDRIFDDFFEWVENTMTTEDQAYVQVVAVCTGASALALNGAFYPQCWKRALISVRISGTETEPNHNRLMPCRT